MIYTKNKGYIKKSEFKVKRSYGFHEGIDYAHSDAKKAKIYNLLDGIIKDVKSVAPDKYYGKTVEVKTNLKYIGGEDCSIIFEYLHLHTIKDEIIGKSLKNGSDRFIKANAEIGLMGNTGNCFTMENGSWRAITDEEKANDDAYQGVHLHLGCKVIKKEDSDNLLNEIKNKTKYTKNICFEQWGKTYFNPEIVIEYIEKLRR